MRADAAQEVRVDAKLLADRIPHDTMCSDQRKMTSVMKCVGCGVNPVS